MSTTIDENNLYEVVKLEEKLFIVYDKTKKIPTPHYYKSFSAASKKCLKIVIIDRALNGHEYFRSEEKNPL